MEQNDEMKYIVVGVIVVFVFLCGIGLWIWKGDTINILDKKEPPPPNYTDMNLFVRDKLRDEPLRADYVLKHENLAIQHGVYDTKVFEIYPTAKINATYDFEAWTAKHYKNSISCRNQKDCTVSLYRIGNPEFEVVKFKDDLYYGIIRVTNGIYKLPIICFDFGNGIDDFQTELKEFEEIPNTLELNYDRCYTTEQNINMNEVKTFNFTLKSDNQVNIILRDRCNGVYDDKCGKDITLSV